VALTDLTCECFFDDGLRLWFDKLWQAVFSAGLNIDDLLIIFKFRVNETKK
jgi:hypothetical protein